MAPVSPTRKPIRVSRTSTVGEAGRLDSYSISLPGDPPWTRKRKDSSGYPIVGGVPWGRRSRGMEVRHSPSLHGRI